MPTVPSIFNGPKLIVKKTVEYDMPCPKCSKEMRVTDISEGAPIECTSCSNVTWRMAYNPPWWSKTSRFALSLVVTFILGIISSLVAATIYENYTKSGNSGVNLQAPTTTTDKR